MTELNRLMSERPLQVAIFTHREHEFAGLVGGVVDVESIAVEAD